MTTEEAVRYALAKEETALPSGSKGSPAATGAVNLTLREREIAKLVARGLTNHQIAGELFISERTVATHVGSIFKKLEVHSRDQVKDLLPDREQAKPRSAASPDKHENTHT